MPIEEQERISQGLYKSTADCTRATPAPMFHLFLGERAHVASARPAAIRASLWAIEPMGRTMMRGADASVAHLCFRHPVGLPNLIHMQSGKHDSFGVPRGDNTACADGLCELLGYIQHNGNQPHEAILQAHGATHAVIVGARHESAQGRKTAAQDRLQVAKLAGRHIPRPPITGGRLQFSTASGGPEKVQEVPTVWEHSYSSDLLGLKRDLR